MKNIDTHSIAEGKRISQMKNIDYSKLTEITVKSQNELDMIPDDFAGRIYIEFGAPFNRAIVNKRYMSSVVARGNSSVVARENSSVVARGNSSVEAWGNSSVVARGNSSVVAWENSSVVARENSSVVARGNSSVVARGNSSVVDRQLNGRIEITGNARIVYMPKTIHEFMDFYDIKHDKKTGKFFKAVHKENGIYYSDHDTDFEYPIGEAVKEKCDPDVNCECSYEIHIAHMAWCLDFGRGWDDLAILEVETDIDNIVLPVNCRFAD